MGCGSSAEKNADDAGVKPDTGSAPTGDAQGDAPAAPAAAPPAPKRPMRSQSKRPNLFSAQDVHDNSSYKDEHHLKNIWDEYTNIKTVGEGGFGRVCIAKRNKDGITFAIKVQDIPRKQNFDRKAKGTLAVFDKEIYVLKNVHHPHICYLHESTIWENEANNTIELCMVLELCQGPELFDAVLIHGEYTEKVAADFFRTILMSVAHLHKNNVVHLDIKPENFVFSAPFKDDGKYEEGEEPKLKLIDFGVAALVPPGTPFIIQFLSVLYSPPEVLTDLDAERDIDGLKAADMWAVGCVLYILLTACRPFEGEDREEVLMEMQSGLGFVEDVVLTDECVDLISRLLEPDPKRRLTAEAAFDHPWMKANHDTTKNLLPPGISAGLKQIGRATKLKRAIAEFVLAKAIDLGDYEIFKKQFAKADKDKDGMLDDRETAVFLQNQKIAESKGLGASDEAELKKETDDVLAAADVDQNAQIDVNEFARVLEMAELSTNDVLLDKVFQRLDTNNNGAISVTELEQAFSGLQMGELIADDFYKTLLADIAKDPTQLTLEEFKAAMMGNGLAKRSKTSAKDYRTKVYMPSATE